MLGLRESGTRFLTTTMVSPCLVRRRTYCRLAVDKTVAAGEPKPTPISSSADADRPVQIITAAIAIVASRAIVVSSRSDLSSKQRKGSALGSGHLGQKALKAG